MSRPPRHIEPVTEPDDRQMVAMAIGKILRIGRHAAKLNMTQTPAEVEQSLRDLQAAVDSALECTNGAA